MDFIVSYAFLALSFSFLETAVVLDIIFSNLSASLPKSSGVSFIGRAIVK